MDCVPQKRGYGRPPSDTRVALACLTQDVRLASAFVVVEPNPPLGIYHTLHRLITRHHTKYCEACRRLGSSLFIFASHPKWKISTHSKQKEKNKETRGRKMTDNESRNYMGITNLITHSPPNTTIFETQISTMKRVAPTPVRIPARNSKQPNPQRIRIVTHELPSRSTLC